MKILVDENIPRMTVNRLRELDHDKRDIRGAADQGFGGALDQRQADQDGRRARRRNGAAAAGLTGGAGPGSDSGPPPLSI